MELIQLPRELLELQLLNFTAHGLYNLRRVNKLYYQIYNSDNFWRLKFRHDHGFIPKIKENESYKRLYYNYKRVYIFFDDLPFLKDVGYPAGYTDLKNFANKVYKASFNVYYFIDLSGNIWKSELIQKQGNYKPPMAVKITNGVRVVDLSISYLDVSDHVVTYLDDSGKLWRVTNSNINPTLIYSDKPIRYFCEFYFGIYFIITYDNDIIYIPTIPTYERKIDVSKLTETMEEINKNHPILKIFKHYTYTIILSSNNNEYNLWIIYIEWLEKNTIVIPKDIYKINDVTDVSNVSLFSVPEYIILKNNKLYKLEIQNDNHNIVPMDVNFTPLKLSEYFYQDINYNTYHYSRKNFIKINEGYVVDDISGTSVANSYIFTGSKIIK